MKIGELMQSKYIKKDDVPKPALVTIESDVWQENLAMEGQPEQEKAIIKFVEFEKPFVANSTNLQLIAQAVGSDETTDWIGKQVVLYHDPTVVMRGKLVGGLRVRASRSPQAPTRPASRAVAPPALSPIDDSDSPF